MISKGTMELNSLKHLISPKELIIFKVSCEKIKIYQDKGGKKDGHPQGRG